MVMHSLQLFIVLLKDNDSLNLFIDIIITLLFISVDIYLILLSVYFRYKYNNNH